MVITEGLCGQFSEQGLPACRFYTYSTDNQLNILLVTKHPSAVTKYISYPVKTGTPL
jgi:hypothetical protein